MDCGRPRQSVTVHERTICRKRHECSAELLTGSIVCVAMLRPRSAQRHGMVFRRRLRFLDGDRRFFFRDLAIRAHRNGEAILRGGLPWTFAASAESTHGPRRDHPTAQTRVWALPVEETPHLSLNWIGYFPCRAISRGAQTPNRVLVVCGAGRGVSSFAVATWQLGSLPPPSSQDHLRHLARTARATLIVLPPRYPSSPRHRKSLHREPASAPADDFWPSTHGQFVGQPQPSWLKSHGRRQLPTAKYDVNGDGGCQTRS